MTMKTRIKRVGDYFYPQVKAWFGWKGLVVKRYNYDDSVNYSLDLAVAKRIIDSYLKGRVVPPIKTSYMRYP